MNYEYAVENQGDGSLVTIACSWDPDATSGWWEVLGLDPTSIDNIRYAIISLGKADLCLFENGKRALQVSANPLLMAPSPSEEELLDEWLPDWKDWRDQPEDIAGWVVRDACPPVYDGLDLEGLVADALLDRTLQEYEYEEKRF